MDLTALFAQGGPYAVVAVLLGVVAKLWIDGKDKDALLIKMLTEWRLDTSVSNDKLYGALETLKAVMAQGARK